VEESCDDVPRIFQVEDTAHILTFATHHARPRRRDIFCWLHRRCECSIVLFIISFGPLHHKTRLMERKRQWEALLVIVAAATVPSALAFAPTAFVSFPCCRRMAVPAGSNTISSTTSRIAMSSANHEDPLWKKAWNRLDTLESAGLKQKGERDAPVLARGPGLKRALFWLGVAFLYKWYRARFINKVWCIESARCV
jgi:hypothetical protein